MLRYVQKNYTDQRLRDLAHQKAGLSKSAVAAVASEQPKYRDRASERRIMHHQPDVPLPSEQDNPAKKRHVDGTTTAQSTAGLPQLSPPPHAHPGNDDTNIGNKLLKKMGWREGTGLGWGGEGITEPLSVACPSALELVAHAFSAVKQPSMLRVLVWVLAKVDRSVNMQKGTLDMCTWRKRQ
jgi:RNA-binding protein 5/10